MAKFNSLVIAAIILSGCSGQKASNYLFQFQKGEIQKMIDEKAIVYNLALSRIEFAKTKVVMDPQQKEKAVSA